MSKIPLPSRNNHNGLLINVNNPDIMNPLIAVALVGVGVIVLNKWQTASAAPQLNYVLQGVTADFKALYIQINVDIGIQNPTSSSFTIKSFSGNLFVNDYYIGNVSNFTAVLIQGNAQTNYRAAVQISTLALPSAILAIFQNFSGLNAKLTGTINVDNLSIPLSLDYKGM